MKREEILRIISESPLSILLSEKEKMEVIERILKICNSEKKSEPYNPISEF
jgi:hypothetical protein